MNFRRIFNYLSWKDPAHISCLINSPESKRWWACSSTAIQQNRRRHPLWRDWFLQAETWTVLFLSARQWTAAGYAVCTSQSGQASIQLTTDCRWPRGNLCSSQEMSTVLRSHLRWTHIIPFFFFFVTYARCLMSANLEKGTEANRKMSLSLCSLIKKKRGN